MKNAPVLVVKQSSNGDYKHVTLPTDGKVCTLSAVGFCTWNNAGEGNEGAGGCGYSHF